MLESRSRHSHGQNPVYARSFNRENRSRMAASVRSGRHACTARRAADFRGNLGSVAIRDGLVCGLCVVQAVALLGRARYSTASAGR